MSGDPTASTAKVLTSLAGSGTATLAQLRAATGLSRQTLTPTVAQLQRAGWVEPAGRARAQGGRPAQRWRVGPRACLVAGVDVGPGAVRVVLGGPQGATLAATRTPVTAADADGLLDAVASAVARATADVGLTPSELGAVGIAVPGIVADDGVVRRSDIVAAWSGVPVGPLMAQRLGCPVVAENDVNLAALGEHRAGVSYGAQDVLHVHVGRRCITELLVGGRVHAGRHGAAGEIGAIPRLFLDPVVELLGSRAATDDPRFDAVLVAAVEGEGGARRRVHTLAEAIARLVQVLGSFADPDLVVISGPVARVGAVLLDHVREHVTFGDDVAPQVVLGALAERAMVVGAVARALQRAARDRPELAAVLAAQTLLGTSEIGHDESVEAMA